MLLLESTSTAVPTTTTEGSIGPVIIGVVAGIGVSILFIGVILIMTAILWRYHLQRVKNKSKTFSILNLVNIWGKNC